MRWPIHRLRLSIQTRLLLGLMPGVVLMAAILLVSMVALFSLYYQLWPLVGGGKEPLPWWQWLAYAWGNTGSLAAEAPGKTPELAAAVEAVILVALRRVGALIVVAGVGAGLFVWWFSRSINRPLQALAEQAQALEQGRPVAPVPLRRSDEIGELVARFNHMARALEESQRHLRELLAYRTQGLERLTDLSASINQVRDLDDILRRALEHALAMTKATQGGIWIAEEDGVLTLRVSQGLDPGFDMAEARLPFGYCLCGQAAQDGRSLRIEAPGCPYPLEGELCCAHGIASLLVIPVRTQNKVVGLIRLASTRPGAFHAEHQAYMEAMGHHLGVAIENARLYMAERRQRELAETLQEVGKSLVMSLDLDQVLTGILHQIGRVLEVDAGLILLREEGDMLRVAAVRGRPELHMSRWLGYRFPAQESPGLQAVLASGIPQTFCRPDRVNLFEQGIERLEAIDWCLVVPLASEGRVIGLMTLEQIGHCYEQSREAQIAFAFANQAVIAIENARLFEELERLNQELETRVQQRTQELVAAQATLERQAAQLRRLLQSIIQVQEQERERIAREVHDGVVQWILSAMYELQAIRVRLAGDAGSQEKLATVQEMLKRIKEEMYQVIYGLLPPLLRTDGLAAALRALAADMEHSAGIRCRVHVQGMLPRLAPEIELAAYRIVQESIRNALDHGQADTVEVLIQTDAEGLNVWVIDNGVGFNPRDVHDGNGHLGLISMQERALSVGGEIQIRSRPGNGTTVWLRVPISIDTLEEFEGDRSSLAQADAPSNAIFDPSAGRSNEDEHDGEPTILSAASHASPHPRADRG